RKRCSDPLYADGRRGPPDAASGDWRYAAGAICFSSGNGFLAVEHEWKTNPDADAQSDANENI
ncbi:MAG: hypothetical protein GY941_19605, partial [Planctomycetes bacterium]|nr:hypothetical protein [Planctomycetota bacterium]